MRQDQRGSANGLAMSIVSLFKAIGPAGGGSLFAWSQTRTQASFLRKAIQGGCARSSNSIAGR
ncbi:hypothetical protein O6H91_03G118300 [Diphasiastrum complanatum]|uniref:Uncharacterized protein n=1 Tax=Diphasiastrum complanatum TaxID=34168 RepID=A0ACC2EAZ0_DIPCM|nr:hypothetical protein O6H91_03G118300 [Diphasiastrum complanatum]